VIPEHDPADNPYPLRGTAYRYERPTDPVAEDDWEAARECVAIDADFAGMANDDTYRSEAATLAEQFAASDWEAFRES
jgi:hypothetical protein